MTRFPFSLSLLAALSAAGSAADPETAGLLPRREDRGALIVLHVRGSYEEMGAQQVELLGVAAHRAYRGFRFHWERRVERGGLPTRLLGTALLPLVSWIAKPFEESGFFDELAGMADALGVSRADLSVGLFGAMLTGGSTAFAATGSATADGSAVLGRNADWQDNAGRHPPVAVHYHPTNGDQAFLAVGLPLLPIPVIGLNASGLAMSINTFEADEMWILGLPQIPYRRIMQRADSVDAAIAIFEEVGNRGGAGFVVLADAAGNIAQVECIPSRCSVFRPEEDWLAQANHARTPEMIPHDLGRQDDSFRRHHAMEDAVRRYAGRIAPELAARILRDRSNSRYVNDSTVANPYVLNSAVVHPASGTLWHSTTMQPSAPFGEMVPFSVARDVSRTPPLPADPRLGTPQLEYEVAVIEEMRRATRLFEEGRLDEAGVIWDRVAGQGEPSLEPARLAFARARVRWTRGELEEADALLEGVDRDDTLFTVRVWGLAARAAIADRLGRRADALSLYRRTQALLDSRLERKDVPAPDGGIESLRAQVEAGLLGPWMGDPFPAGDLQHVPR